MLYYRNFRKYGVPSAMCDADYAVSFQKEIDTATRAIRLREDSVNSESDFGFVGKLLDIAAVDTFLGVNNGFGTKWYDLKENVDLSQNVYSSQPIFVKDYFGTDLHSFEFDPSGFSGYNNMYVDYSSYDPNLFSGELTAFCVFDYQSGIGTVFKVGQANSYNLALLTVAPNSLRVISGTSAAFNPTISSALSTNTTAVVTIRRSGSTGNWRYVVNVNGTNVYDNTTAVNPNTSQTRIILGSYDLFSSIAPLDGNIGDLFLFDSALTDTQIDSCEAYLKNKYSIT